MSEAQKAWGKVPSDEDWHRAMHAKEEDPRCKLCLLRRHLRNGKATIRTRERLQRGQAAKA